MAGTTKTGFGKRGNRLRPLVWGGAALLLALPAVAMRLRLGGVDWTAADFAVFGAMLVVACGLYEVAARVSGEAWHRAGAGIAIASGFLTAWANLAVGMVGSEANPFNLLFAGVLGIALAGALQAKPRAAGLARAMLATSFAQALVAAAAFAIGGDPRGASLSALFVAPWLLAAVLFRRSARAAMGA
jgi:hypothetical protein